MSSSFFTQIGSDIDGVAGYETNHLVSLSSDGSTVAIGVQGDFGSGQVRIFKNVNNTWTQVGSYIEGKAYDSTGRSVSLSADGSIIAIGAPYGDGGNVKIYKNLNNTWTQLGSDVNGTNGFGSSVSISADGSIIAIGNRWHDNTVSIPYINGRNRGQVKIYKKIVDWCFRNYNYSLLLS